MRLLSALALSLIVCAPLPAAAEALAVTLDQATRVALPRPARDVVIGNPAIADATVLDARHIVLTGKSAGVTNVMVTDRAGGVILNRELVVSASEANRVTIWRGPDLSVYACGGRCQKSASPAPAPAAAPPGT
jgi:Flp pilus assembly secretin CpaC